MSLLDVIEKVNKQYKKEIATVGIQNLVIKKIPFTSPRMNYMTYGGVPRGRLIEFSGPEGSGKTTTALDIISQAQPLFKQEFEEEITELSTQLENPKLKSKERTELQKKYDELKKRGPLKVAYIDNEGTLDLDWCKKLKVIPEELCLFRLQEHTAEQILDTAIDIIESGDCGLLIIDCIAMLIPQQIYDESLTSKAYCGNAAVVSTFVNKAIPKLGAYGATCIVINQIRDDIANMYNEFKTPCGKALKHQCSLRILFKKGNPIDEHCMETKKNYDSPQGNIVMAVLLKTKVSKPDRRLSSYTLSYDNGVEVVPDLFDVAVQYGVITGSGWYYFLNPETGEYLLDEDGDPFKVQGRENVISLLREDKKLFDMVYTHINNLVSNKESSNQAETSQFSECADEVENVINQEDPEGESNE